MITNTQGGLIKTIIIIIIAVIILGYFGFDLRSIMESEPVQKNLSYVWNFIVNIWDNYLQRPALYLWNDIFIDLIWESFIDNMDRIKEGEPTDLELNAPEPVA
ncbi:hypothetical protein ACFL0K_01330 [Patescibacteria group bacterium]